jgi:hypothetical protein
MIRKEKVARDLEVPRKRRSNMHEDVETWDDTCVCEPEPRWRKLEEEMQEEDRQPVREAPEVS